MALRSCRCTAPPTWPGGQGWRRRNRRLSGNGIFCLLGLMDRLNGTTRCATTCPTYWLTAAAFVIDATTMLMLMVNLTLVLDVMTDELLPCGLRLSGASAVARRMSAVAHCSVVMDIWAVTTDVMQHVDVCWFSARPPPLHHRARPYRSSSFPYRGGRTVTTSTRRGTARNTAEVRRT